MIEKHFMTEKVFLSGIKRTQNRCSSLCLCVLCGKKTKLRTMVYARKSFPFEHKTRIKQMFPSVVKNKFRYSESRLCRFCIKTA